MERLLKFKKLFMLGLAAAVVAMFTPGCSDDDDDTYIPGDDEYVVTVNGGSGSGWYYEDETVTIRAGSPPEIGMEFSYWSSVPTVDFADATDSVTTFPMIADSVTITANFESDGFAYVRFTWETAFQGHLLQIFASEDDIEYWAEEFWDDDVTWADEDFTDVPRWMGSEDIPNNLYVEGGSTANKGKYFKIDEYEGGFDIDDWEQTGDDGWFTAVAHVEDEHGEGFIVANYRVWFTGANDDEEIRFDLDAERWFEVAFDIEAWLDGDDEESWFMEVRDNPFDAPRLQKKTGRRMKKISEKTVVTDFATFEVKTYVIRGSK